MPDRYAGLEKRIAAWAQAQDDIRAVVVVGSRARDDQTADEHSDLDLCLFTTAREHYARSDGWLATFGSFWLAVLETTGYGDPEWLVIYDSDAKADFALLHADPTVPSLAAQIRRLPHHNVFARGLRVLVDKYPQREPIDLPVRLEPLPDAELLATHVRAFLLACTRAAKFIDRGDLWRAQAVISRTLHDQVLTMMAWHARSLHGDHETWYGGRYVERWADARAIAALSGLFPAYGHGALRTAVLAHLTLMRWLAEETAARLGCAFPAAIYDRAVRWIEALHAAR